MRVKALDINKKSPYGLDYSLNIGKSLVLKLTGKPLDIGHERDYCTVADKIYSAFKLRLVIANISGEYFLQCTNVQRSDWNKIFGIEIVGLHN